MFRISSRLRQTYCPIPQFSLIHSSCCTQQVAQSQSKSIRKTPCFELSRLPKASPLKSLRFKRTLPGQSGHLAYGPFSKYDPPLDASHPLASLAPPQLLRAVPHYRCTLFTLNCYPFAVLKKFKNPEYMLTFKQKESSNELAQLLSAVDPKIRIPPSTRTFYNDLQREKRSIPMPLMVLLPKHVHKSGFIRSKLKRRLKEALKLVVIRGAIQTESDDGIKFTFPEGLSPDSVNERLILKDSVYTFRPTAEVYRAPWPTLIKELRQALETVKRFVPATAQRNSRKPTKK